MVNTNNYESYGLVLTSDNELRKCVVYIMENITAIFYQCL